MHYISMNFGHHYNLQTKTKMIRKPEKIIKKCKTAIIMTVPGELVGPTAKPKEKRL